MVIDLLGRRRRREKGVRRDARQFVLENGIKYGREKGEKSEDQDVAGVHLDHWWHEQPGSDRRVFDLHGYGYYRKGELYQDLERNDVFLLS